MTVSQTAFRHGLLDPSLPAPNGLVNPDGAPAKKRFDVYRNNFAVSLSDALESAFPVIRKLVGDNFFRAMSGVYLRQHPPTSPLMMFYGNAMPAFLAQFEPAQSLPYLPDMARLELAMRHAYHAADQDPIAPDALAQIPPDGLTDLRMAFAPAVRVIRSDHPIHSTYLANTTSGAPAAKKGSETTLITRPAFDPTPHLITPETATFFTALSEGQTLGDAANAAGAELDLGASLGLLLGQNAITSLT